MAKKVEKKKQQENYAAPIICAAVIIIALLAVVVATVVSINNNSNNKKNDDQSQVEDGEADYSLFTAVENQDVVDFLEDGEIGFLYVGRPTCSVCQVFAPILTQVVKAEGYKIYYYDTDVANDDKDLKAEVLDKISVTGVPTFMYIKDGVEVDRLIDTTNEESLREFIEKYL
ncbi:MAG: thioredoxin family protein [Candidatus Saccharimonadales bacterium]